MALTDLERNFIASYSMQLLSQDVLTNSLFAGGTFGAAMRGMVLPTAKITDGYTNPMAAALNSRLRSDARSFTQAASNLRDAIPMYETLATASADINDIMDQMLQVLKDRQSGLISRDAARTQYQSLYDQYTALVESTVFNGMPVADGEAWALVESIQGPTGGVGTMIIQTNASGSGGLTATLLDFKGLAENSTWKPSAITFTDWQTRNLNDHILALEGNTTTTGAIQTVAGFTEVYQKRAAELESMATSLEDQAELLAKAAVNRSARVATSEDVFLDYILGKIGSLFDEDA